MRSLGATAPEDAGETVSLLRCEGWCCVDDARHVVRDLRDSEVAAGSEKVGVVCGTLANESADPTACNRNRWMRGTGGHEKRLQARKMTSTHEGVYCQRLALPRLGVLAG
jgi:hypothetical protein